MTDDGREAAARARREFDPRELGARETTLLLKSLLIPRPIAWVGSRAGDGTANLAPHSFVTMASEAPPIVLFTSIGRKDTLRCIEQTGEFTVSIVSSARTDAANLTSAPHPPETSEFEAVGIEPSDSVVVSAPGVAASPAVLECVREQILPVGDGFLVLGRVVHVSVDAEVLRTDDRGRTLPDARALDPMSRLGRSEWAELGRIRAVARPQRG